MEEWKTQKGSSSPYANIRFSPCLLPFDLLKLTVAREEINSSFSLLFLRGL